MAHLRDIAQQPAGVVLRIIVSFWHLNKYELKKKKQVQGSSCLIATSLFVMCFSRVVRVG